MKKLLTTESKREYIIQHYKNGNWSFIKNKKNNKSFPTVQRAEDSIEEMMIFCNDFIYDNFRLIERTEIIIIQPIEKKGGIEHL